MAFGHSRRRWFGTCSCPPVPRSLPSSIKQLHTLGPPRPFALVAHHHPGRARSSLPRAPASSATLPPTDPRRNAGRDWLDSAIRNGPAYPGAPPPLVSDPMFRKLDQRFMLGFVEKGSNTERTQAYPNRESSSLSCARSPPIARPMHLAGRALTGIPGCGSVPDVAEAQKVLFPDLVENCSYRVLDDRVLQRRNPQWSFPSIGFRYPDSSRRLRMIRPAMDSPMQVAQARLQVLSIFLPRHPIHSRRRLSFQAVVALPEQVDAYVVQQGRELQLPVLRCFTHTRQPAWPVLPARCPARVRLLRVLLGRRPSLCKLRRRSPAFVRLFRW